MRITQEQYSALSHQFESNIKTDTIRAFDDTNAYSKAVNHWYGLLSAEKITRYRVSKSTSFEVYSPNFISLKITVSKHARDSIDAIWDGIGKHHLESIKP